MASLDSMYIGQVTLTLATFGTGSTGAIYTANSCEVPFRANAKSNKIYALLLAGGTYTPKHAGKYDIIVWTKQ